MPYPRFDKTEHGTNVVCSETPVTNYPELMFMNVGVDKLHYFASIDAKYLFDFMVNDTREVYFCSALDLEKALKDNCTIIQNGTERYSFFLQYNVGELRANPGQDNFFRLKKMVVDNDYEKYKKYVSFGVTEAYKFIIAQALRSGCNGSNKVFKERDILIPLEESFGSHTSPLFKRQLDAMINKSPRIFRGYGDRIRFEDKSWAVFSTYKGILNQAGTLDRIAVSYQNMKK